MPGAAWGRWQHTTKFRFMVSGHVVAPSLTYMGVRLWEDPSKTTLNTRPHRRVFQFEPGFNVSCLHRVRQIEDLPPPTAIFYWIGRELGLTACHKKSRALTPTSGTFGDSRGAARKGPRPAYRKYANQPFSSFLCSTWVLSVYSQLSALSVKSLLPSLTFETTHKTIQPLSTLLCVIA
jgi:hypothetical protein